MLTGFRSSPPGRGRGTAAVDEASMERWSQPGQRRGGAPRAVGFHRAGIGPPSSCGRIGRGSPPYLRAPGRSQAPPPGRPIRCSGCADRAGAPGFRPPVRGADNGAGERRARAEGGGLHGNRGKLASSRVFSSSGPQGPPAPRTPCSPCQLQQPGRQERPFLSAKTTKTSTVPTCSAQARPQASSSL